MVKSGATSPGFRAASAAGAINKNASDTMTLFITASPYRILRAT
jgi:hypothetical protein